MAALIFDTSFVFKLTRFCGPDLVLSEKVPTTGALMRLPSGIESYTWICFFSSQIHELYDHKQINAYISQEESALATTVAIQAELRLFKPFENRRLRARFSRRTSQVK